jgi:hypothetical protein
VKKIKLTLGVMLTLAFVALLTWCKQWTPQDTQVAVDVGGEILCAIEHAELDDPALEALCAQKGLAPDAGQATLHPEAKKAAVATRKKLAAARSACRPIVNPTVGP